MDELLAALKTLFVKLFEPFLSTFVASLHAGTAAKASLAETVTTWNFASVFEGWDKYFNALLKQLEEKAALVSDTSPLATVS